MGRPSWDDYFLTIAAVAAMRSTCDRRNVGCVLVRDKAILSTGYNGSVRGLPHCDEVGHDMQNGSCVRTCHAEINAIAQAAKNGASVDGATAYVTCSPCWNCFKLLANAGIKRIVYAGSYPDERFKEAAKLAGIELDRREDLVGLDKGTTGSVSAT